MLYLRDLITTLRYFNFPSVTDEEPEADRGRMTGASLHVVELGFNPSSVSLLCLVAFTVPETSKRGLYYQFWDKLKSAPRILSFSRVG